MHQDTIDFKKMSKALNIPIERCMQITDALLNKNDIRNTEGIIPFFKETLITVDDLAVGMVLSGVVSNVTDFGAFIDTGIHVDGLLHKSQLSNRFITDIHSVLSVGMHLKVEVIGIETKNNKLRISFSSKNTENF